MSRLIESYSTLSEYEFYEGIEEYCYEDSPPDCDEVYRDIRELYCLLLSAANAILARPGDSDAIASVLESARKNINIRRAVKIVGNVPNITVDDFVKLSLCNNHRCVLDVFGNKYGNALTIVEFWTYDGNVGRGRGVTIELGKITRGRAEAAVVYSYEAIDSSCGLLDSETNMTATYLVDSEVLVEDGFTDFKYSAPIPLRELEKHQVVETFYDIQLAVALQMLADYLAGAQGAGRGSG